jgi:alpha-1,3-rhamnosyl/mannosyltransferase
VLAGSKGWLSNDLQAQIARGQGEGWLHYLGFVPEPILPLLYAGAYAFLYPSVYEGFGLPVLEALASGAPTLASNCSSLPEVAGGAAWLVEPDNDEALREGIERVLTDQPWRDHAIALGLSVAAAHSWQKCAGETLNLCRRFA